MVLLDYFQLAHDNQILIYDFPLNGTDALSIPGAIAINTRKICTFRDLKDKLSHEMGHCMTCSFYNTKNPLDVRERHETRANRWKMAHEVPRDAFFDALEHGVTEIWQLAEHFDVTEDFMRMTAEYYIENPPD